MTATLMRTRSAPDYRAVFRQFARRLAKAVRSKAARSKTPGLKTTRPKTLKARVQRKTRQRRHG